MDDNKFTIGEISKICDVTTDTLRYYDEMGLLKPEHSEQNKYRYYNADHIWTLEVIKICRRMGVSISRLCEIFALQEDDKTIEIIKEQRREINQQLKQIMQMKQDMIWFEEEWNSRKEVRINEVYFKNIDERKVLYHTSPKQVAQTHVLKENVIREAVRSTKSVKRKYGFILNKETFLENTYYRDGEYVNLYQNTYPKESQEYLLTLPAGEYYCMPVLSTKDSEEQDNRKRNADMKPLLERLREDGVTPKTVIAEEVGCPFFQLDKTVYEIQVYPDRKNCKKII